MKLPSMKIAGRRIAMLIAIGTVSLVQAAPVQTIDVHRDPNCGCCSKWITYLRDNGFTVNDHLEDNMSAVKTQLGVPDKLGSCHTGVVNGKFVEGHVPVRQITELVKRSDLKGVAAPGMPMGSPGMESGSGGSAYQVIGLTTQGEELVVADYPAK